MAFRGAQFHDSSQQNTDKNLISQMKLLSAIYVAFLHVLLVILRYTRKFLNLLVLFYLLVIHFLIFVSLFDLTALFPAALP